MTSYLEKIGRGENPFVATEINELDGRTDALYELKFGLVLYTNYPPGPKRARKVFELYTSRYANRIKRYVATVPGSFPEEWTATTRRLFENQLLPTLRQGPKWGYGFDDGNTLDSYLFMFHGYRPVRDEGTASFFRFEFPWNVDQAEVREFATAVAQTVPFENGFGGYFFSSAVVAESYNKMYAVCRRFWGIDAWNLDMTVDYVLQGYQSVNWLTLIGDSLRQRSIQAVERAKAAAVSFIETRHGVILQAADHALLGDRNLGERMPGYTAVAQALLPLQVKTFGSFGGERWNEQNSLAWIRRFTDPDGV